MNGHIIQKSSKLSFILSIHFNEYNIPRNITQIVFKNLLILNYPIQIHFKQRIIEFWIILNRSQKRVPKLDTGMRDIWPVIHPKMHQMQVHPRSVQAVRSSVISSLFYPVELSSKGFFPRWKLGVISQLRRTDVAHAFQDVLGILLILRFRFSFCVKLDCSWKWYSQLSRSRSWLFRSMEKRKRNGGRVFMILNYTLVDDCGDEDRNKRKMSCDDKLLVDFFVVLGKSREILAEISCWELYKMYICTISFSCCVTFLNSFIHYLCASLKKMSNKGSKKWRKEFYRIG